jgi:GNAT superfamily N-acetyltransferase
VVRVDIRAAETGEQDIVLGLLAQRIAWLHRRGSDQWSRWNHWPPKIIDSIAAGDVWLACDAGRPVGTITIEFHGDPDFWTETENAEPAAYLSKLATDPAYAGRDLGALIIAWAIDRAYHHNARVVRLDAWKTNTKLHAYYRAHGWTYLRTVANSRRNSGALFQIDARPMNAEQRRHVTP